eukprot:Phypoly_transcript_10980.p1 GENE.Phypoly_transcript_10980~~Phypoly_transcript_10980.p1  ORF type:complete len:393 (+),score=57.82 Phypoly_transcript_10980:107-1180(+)
MDNLQHINTSGKFIVFQTNYHSGLGNRIPPLVSTLLLAIITKRGFLVDWTTEPPSTNIAAEEIAMVEFKELFEPPFAIDATLFPDLHKSINEENTIVVGLQRQKIPDMLLCHDWVETYQNKQYVVLQGFRPIMDTLVYNPNYKAKLESSGFPENGNSETIISIMKAVGKCMLAPSKRVKDMLHQFHEENQILPFQEVVGVHIRATSNTHALNITQQEEVWKLVTKKHPPPPPKTPISQAKLLYFLATDSNSTFLNVPESVKPYLLFQTAPEEISRITSEGIQRALADILLLGNTKEFFGARSTTFISCVRILFDTTFSELRFSPKHKLFLDTVGEVPCYTNWKIEDLSCNLMENVVC